MSASQFKPHESKKAMLKLPIISKKNIAIEIATKPRKVERGEKSAAGFAFQTKRRNLIVSGKKLPRPHGPGLKL
jgi:hypothetical protein